MLALSYRKDSSNISEEIRKIFFLIRCDHIYLIVLLCGILCYLVYAQIESTVPQYLFLLNSTQEVNLLTTILVTNAVTLILSQIWRVT